MGNFYYKDVWIYGTNIYVLYKDIEKEYGVDWYIQDIDLPYIVSKKDAKKGIQYKADFTDIIIVFDYERHDSNFSEDKIVLMQEYFQDTADTGKLYINYPMIESYQHITNIPDYDFYNRTIPVTLQPGKKYKELVRTKSIIADNIIFPQKLLDLLSNHFHIDNPNDCYNCYYKILCIDSGENIEERLKLILQNLISERERATAINQIKDWILKRRYVEQGQSYWQYMRGLFQYIIKLNIRKAIKIQDCRSSVYTSDDLRSLFEKVNFTTIVKEQNNVSRDSVYGYIWVLNTCLIFVADYSPFLMTL